MHVVSTLGPMAVGKHLALVLAHLHRSHPGPIVNLGRDEPFGPVLRTQGLTIQQRPWRGLLDWNTQGWLRYLIRESKLDALHLWGDTAVRAAAIPLATLTDRPAVIVADSHENRGWRGWLARRVRNLAASVTDLPWAVGAAAPPIARELLDIPPDRVLITAAGAFDPETDYRTVIWATDMLRYMYPAITVQLIGDGPARPVIERMVRNLQGDRSTTTRFWGARADVASLLAASDIVMIAQRSGGVNLALEAMAAGVPVVARETLELGELLRAYPAGRLVPNGEPATFAKVLLELAREPHQRRSLGEVGRTAAARIGTHPAIEHWQNIYETVASLPGSHRTQ